MFLSAESFHQERLDPGRVIHRFGDRCLRRSCRPADPTSSETKHLVRRLWRILEADGGVGLAAPQIGKELRVVIVRNPEAPAAKSRTTLINPQIMETFGEDVAFEEGCLSFPGLFAYVIRPGGVVVNFTDEGGHAHQIRDDGMFARIVMHEVDHLDGVLFVDHFSFFQKLGVAPRLLIQLAGFVLWKLRNR